MTRGSTPLALRGGGKIGTVWVINSLRPKTATWVPSLTSLWGTLLGWSRYRWEPVPRLLSSTVKNVVFRGAQA